MLGPAQGPVHHQRPARNRQDQDAGAPLAPRLNQPELTRSPKVEAILQILQKHPYTHILVCGASNPSADTLLKRLATKLAPRDLLRLNAPSRPFTEVNNVILPFCYVENDLFALPNIGCVPFASQRIPLTQILPACSCQSA